MTAFFDRDLEASGLEAIRRLQWDKLTRLARALAPANAFVTQKWKAAGLAGAEDLRSWDDFSRLPFTRKAELGLDQAAHPPFGTNLTYPIDRYVRVHQTSGTSGAPLRQRPINFAATHSCSSDVLPYWRRNSRKAPTCSCSRRYAMKVPFRDKVSGCGNPTGAPSSSG